MNRKSVLLMVLLLGIILLSNCTGNNNEVSYAFDIQPTFDKYCLHCHGTYAPAADLCLANYDSLMAGNSVNGPVVNPELKPKYSLLFQRVAWEPPLIQARMPMDGPPYLSQQEIDYIWRWIYNGAQDN